MNIAILSFEYPPETGFGGIGTYSYYHARALVKLGHRVHVFAGAARNGIFHSEHDGVRVTRIKNEGWVHRLLAPARTRRCFWFNSRVETACAAYLALQDALARQTFDIVEAPECGADAAVSSVLTRVPLAIRFHSPARLIMDTYDTTALDRRLTGVVEQVAIGRARIHTSCSQFLANEVQTRMGVRGPIHVIPNGLDLDLFDRDEGLDIEREFGLPRDGVRIVFANRLEERKGVHLIGAIASRILKRHGNVHFVLAGRDLFGYADHTLLPHIRAAGLGERFRVLGALDFPHVRALVKSADLFLLPSLWENCPYSCLEAMAASCAIVSSDCGGMPELIVDGSTGRLASSGDVDSFVDRLEQLIGSADERKRLGRNARAAVEERLTANHIARRTAELYDRELNASSRQPVVLTTTGTARR